MGESKLTLIFPRMLYFFARERITDNFADESIIDCIVLLWEWVNNNASSGCKNWEVRRMLSQRHVQCRVLWHVGEIQETGGWDFQSPLCIISCWFLPVSCKSRKWRKSHNLDMGYFSFTTGYCFTDSRKRAVPLLTELNDRCVVIYWFSLWRISCSIINITVYYFHFEIL